MTPPLIDWAEVPEGPVWFRLTGRWRMGEKLDGALWVAGDRFPLHRPAEYEFCAAEQQPGEHAAEVAEALRILAPSMPSSGLIDACKQVKQVAISEADNSEVAEAALTRLRAGIEGWSSTISAWAIRLFMHWVWPQVSPPSERGRSSRMADFIPHGAECEADHDNGPEWGRCHEPAVAKVLGRFYVCREHLRRMPTLDTLRHWMPLPAPPAHAEARKPMTWEEAAGITSVESLNK